MGLLDDAIREHLDLKRRHGADPAEVERAEREALGPVKRNRESPTAEDLADPEFADETDLGDDAAPAGFAYDQAEDAPWGDGSEEIGLDEPELPTHGAHGLDEDEEPRVDSPRRTGRSSSPETAEYDVEGAMASHEQEGEDMLEETPEFLQDTPDHDRMWFEQRPPKDFDFDS